MAAPTPISPDVLYPLSFMRAARSLPALTYEKIEAMDMPEPYRSLLVHEGDMTSRLEAHQESPIKVSCLRSSNNGKLYFREVMLQTKVDEKPTEYGAIEVNLHALPEEIRPLVIQARQPLGGILNDHRIPYSSAPRAFLKVVPDGPIVEAFGTVEADYLYGRSNVISGYNGDVIAQIVEILPPL
jgi:chorismate-pyruvate lyase